MRMIFDLAAFASTLLVCGCAAQPAPTPPSLGGTGSHAPVLLPTAAGTNVTLPALGTVQTPPGFAGTYSLNDEGQSVGVSTYSTGTASIIGSFFSISGFPAIGFSSLGKPMAVNPVIILAQTGSVNITVSGGAGTYSLRTYVLSTLANGYNAAIVDVNGNHNILGTTTVTNGGCAETVSIFEEITIDPHGNLEYIVYTATGYTQAPTGACNYWTAVTTAGGADGTRAAQVQAAGLSYYYAMYK